MPWPTKSTTVEVPREVPGTCSGRILQRLAGPRFIDPPIRALALIFALSGLVPGAAESDEGGYLLFFATSLALFVVAAFRPLIAGFACIGLHLAFTLVYPIFLNPFDIPIEFAAAVLMAQWRWKTSLAVWAAAFGLTWLSHLLAPEVAMPYNLVLFGVLQYSAIALAAAYAERRINREVVLRTDVARKHERQLIEERIGFAVEAHDTVAHGLATEASIMQLLAPHVQDSQGRRLLGELSLTNGEVQQELRSFLTDLGAGEAAIPTTGSGAENELRRTLDSLRRAAELTGLDLDVRNTLAPGVLDSTRVREMRFILRELVTNMVKHASREGGCLLSVRLDPESERTLVMESSNPCGHSEPGAPLSLSLRADALGGSCEARREASTYRVTVSIPIGGA